MIKSIVELYYCIKDSMLIGNRRMYMRRFYMFRKTYKFL